MKQVLKKMVVCGCAVALVIGQMFPVFAQEREIGEQTFGELSSDPYDVSRIHDLLGAIKKESKIDDNEELVEDLFHEISKQLDALATSSMINGIYFHKDTTNQERADLEQTYYTDFAQTMDETYLTFKEVMDTPYKKIIRDELGWLYGLAIMSYDELQEDELDDMNAEKALILEYEQLLMGYPTVMVDGEEWTTERLSDDSASIPKETRRKVVQAFEEEKETRLGEIFVELAALRWDMAEEMEQSYIDYSYAIYGRDYSPSQSKDLHASVKRYFVPLYNELSAKQPVNEEALWEISSYEDAELVENIGQQMAKLSPELDEVYDFMLKHELYDVEPSETKLGVGYTTYLYQYDAPFIFNKPYDNYYDYCVMVHEFGHFFNAYYQDTLVLSMEADSIGVAEIHSQALELLYMDSYKEVFEGEQGEAIANQTLMNIMDSVIQGALYDEFQTRVYERRDWTVEEINQLFEEVALDYGISLIDNTQWMQVTHNYQTPFYYLSYATSALTALDIWTQSFEDQEQAMETYLSVAQETGLLFKEVAKENDLRNIFKNNEMMSIAKDIANEYELEGAYLVPEVPIDLFIGVAVLGIALLLVGIYLHERKQRKALEELIYAPFDD